MNTLRRIAAHTVIFAEGNTYKQHVVEIIDSRVVRHYPLQEELPYTEWVSGTLLVDSGAVFRLTTSADGTLHRQPL